MGKSSVVQEESAVRQDSRYYHCQSPSSALPPTTFVPAVPHEIARHSTVEARQLVPVEFAFRLLTLPLSIVHLRTGITLTAAIPSNLINESIEKLRFFSGARIVAIPVPHEVIHEAIFTAYYGDTEGFSRSITSQAQKKTPLAAPADIRFNGEKPSSFDMLLRYATAQDASDVHLVPTDEGYFIRLRVRGEILSHHAPIGSMALYEELVRRAKVLCDLPSSPTRLPLDGSFHYPLPHRVASIRVSIIPTVHGERVSLRLISGGVEKNLSSIGFPPVVLTWIEHVLLGREGLLLLTGSTGSGKTTSLYAMIGSLFSRGRSVITIEDPVEQLLKGISQVSIDHQAGLTLETAFAGALRHDPDAILLGEIRSQDAAREVLRASYSGHLILSTIHGGTVVQALERYASLGCQIGQILGPLRLLIAQRLIPRLCQACKVVDLRASNVCHYEVFQPAGCAICQGSGFDGRALLAEALLINDEVREVFATASSTRAALGSVSKGSFFSFGESAKRLCSAGLIPFSNDLL